MRSAPALLCAALLLVAGCSNGPSRQVATPPPTAAPATVVAAYLDALDAHDVDTARRLLTAQHARDVAAAQDSWFSNVESITNVHVGPPVRSGATHGSRRVTVAVSFDLRQHHEVSMPDGHTPWAYQLVRRDPSDRWLIAGEGMG